MESIKSIHNKLMVEGHDVWTGTDKVYIRVSSQVWWELWLEYDGTYIAQRLRNFKQHTSEPVVQFTVRNMRPDRTPTWEAAICESTYKDYKKRFKEGKLPKVYGKYYVLS